MRKLRQKQLPGRSGVCRKPIADAKIADEVGVTRCMRQIHNVGAVTDYQMSRHSCLVRQFFNVGLRHFHDIACRQVLIAKTQNARTELVRFTGRVGLYETFMLKRVKNPEYGGPRQPQPVGNFRDCFGFGVLTQKLQNIQSAVQRWYDVFPVEGVRRHADVYI